MHDVQHDYHCVARNGDCQQIYESLCKVQGQTMRIMLGKRVRYQDETWGGHEDLKILN